MLPKPNELIVPTAEVPKILSLYGMAKCGKTTLIAGMPDTLLIDLEKGTGFVSACKKDDIDSYKDLDKLFKEIEEENKKINGYYYKRIAIDTVGILEDLCAERAIEIYKATPMGKDFKLLDIRLLPNGAGYYWLREAFIETLERLKTLCETVVLISHIKDKVVLKGIDEVQSFDIDLTGKIKTIFCRRSDAVGYIFRKKDKVYISFKTQEDVVCGARPKHLKNKEFVVSELKGEEVVVDWSQILIK